MSVLLHIINTEDFIQNDIWGHKLQRSNISSINLLLRSGSQWQQTEKPRQSNPAVGDMVLVYQQNVPETPPMGGVLIRCPNPPQLTPSHQKRLNILLLLSLSPSNQRQHVSVQGPRLVVGTPRWGGGVWPGMPLCGRRGQQWDRTWSVCVDSECCDCNEEVMHHHVTCRLQDHISPHLACVSVNWHPSGHVTLCIQPTLWWYVFRQSCGWQLHGDAEDLLPSCQ